MPDGDGTSRLWAAAVSNELKKVGMFVSPAGVRSIWLRHDLETFKKRLKALEAKAAQENWVLTEEQLQALEKAKEEKEAVGEIETSIRDILGPKIRFMWDPKGSRTDLPADVH